MNVNSRNYENFLKYRMNEFSTFVWVSRQLNTQIAYKQDTRPTPASHKQAVLKSLKIQELIEKISLRQGIEKTELENQVKVILDEIGYNKNLKLIRWIALFLAKVCLKISTGIYVNVDNIIQLKTQMGDCPVIFVPSHRSYADFILMSYLCFSYDIEIPAIAAGMDFHGMWGIGNMLRDTGAFFMRRSYNSDSLYWTTFKQYVYQLVTKGDLPIEFFIEGTRSRSNKTLAPKYGLISMILKAFLFSEVFDILFVPINISYDRILEETLFAFELLGVPKPKESTSAFFKSLKIIKEKFGNMHLHFNKPISAREFFGNKLNRSVHSLKAIHQQEITEEEKNLIVPLAYEIVYTQQKSCIITIFNLVSLILNDNFANTKTLLTMTELISEVRWVKDVIESFGAYVHTEDIEKSIADCFIVHNNLIQLTPENTICLVENRIIFDETSPSTLKAHSLSEKTMTYSVPFVMLQIYINPTLHYFVDAAILSIIVNYKVRLNKEELFNNYHFLRSLFSMEFVIFLPHIKMEFETALQYSVALDTVKVTEDHCYEGGHNKKLQDFLYTTIEPFMVSYFVMCHVLERIPSVCDEKTILIEVQKVLEVQINDNSQFIHPYCLNLDSLCNCLNSLFAAKAVQKIRSENKVMYEINRDKLTPIKEQIGEYIPKCHVENSFIESVQFQSKL